MKPIAKVINNNQSGWTNIIETEPNVTLDIGTELFLDSDLDLRIEVQTMRDTLQFILEHGSDELWASVGGQAYGAISESLESATALINKMKAREE